MNTTLQIPLSKSLKSDAQAVAQEYGFSSLQEIVRIILTKLARRQLIIRVAESDIQLSKKNEKRYAQMSREFKLGKNTFLANDVDELITQLDA